MLRTKLRPAMLAVLLAAIPAASSAAIDCEQATSTPELNQCAEQAYDAADAKLNASFKKLLASIKASSGDKPYDPVSWERALRKTQKAWISFRDADCKDLLPMSWSGGTGTTAAVYGCLTEKTTARTRELDVMLNGEQ